MTFAEKLGTDGLRRTRGLLAWWGAADSGGYPNDEQERASSFVTDLHALVDTATSRLGQAQMRGHDRFAQTAVQALRTRTADEARELKLVLLYVLRESAADQIGILDQLSRELEQRAEKLVDRTKCTPIGFAEGGSAAPRKAGACKAQIDACETRAA